MNSVYPVGWVRLSGIGDLDDGVYLCAADVAGWLRNLGRYDLAELLEDESQWPPTEQRTVFGVGA